MDEIRSCVEVVAEIILGMILSRNVQRIRDMLFGMPYVYVFASS